MLKYPTSWVQLRKFRQYAACACHQLKGVCLMPYFSKLCIWWYNADKDVVAYPCGQRVCSLLCMIYNCMIIHLWHVSTSCSEQLVCNCQQFCMLVPYAIIFCYGGLWRPRHRWFTTLILQQSRIERWCWRSDSHTPMSDSHTPTRCASSLTQARPYLLLQR